MKNYVILAVSLAAVIVVCVAVIHYEAEQTRETMRTVARDEIGGVIRQEVDDSLEKAEQETTDLGKIIGRIETATVGGGSETSADKPRPNDDKSSTQEPLEQLRRMLGSVVPGAATPDEPQVPGAPPKDPLDGVFGQYRGLARAADEVGQGLLGLNEDQERQVGELWNAELMQSSTAVRDRAVIARVKRVAAPLLERRRRRGINYTFTVVESDGENINAGSIPGGYVYVNQALIDFVRDDQELQFVLGHEIGHVDLGHCVRRAAYVVAAERYAGKAASMAVLLQRFLTLPYSQENEFEADAYGFRAVIAAGQTRDQALTFARRLGQHERDRGRLKSRLGDSPSTLGSMAQSMRTHYETHPPMDERLRRLQAIDVHENAAP